MKSRIKRIGALVPAMLMAFGTAAQGGPLKPGDVRQAFFASCFLNDQEGWIVGELGRILHTTDGAKTFERFNPGTKAALTGIVCFDDKSLTVTGPDGLILRSKDGGAKWEKMTSGTKWALLNIAYATPQIGVAVGDSGTIVRTEDGGNTWTSIPLPTEIPLPEEAAMTIDPGDILLYDVEFADAEHGWIVGEFGVILTTSDGGKTWTAQKSPVEVTLFGVEFADPQHGWAVGLEAAFIGTTDGGATWTKQPMPADRGFQLSMYDLSISGQHGWVVGDSGFLLHTSDRGVTWKRVEMPIELAGNWFRDVSMTPSGTGFLIGGGGLVMVAKKDQIVPAGN